MIRCMTILTLLCFGLAPLPARAGLDPADIARLGWLEGHWSGAKDGVQSEEHWTSPGGGGLVSMHKDVKDGRMISFEFARIGPGAQGRPCYFASPGGAPPVPFRLIELGDARAVFENPEHDFPPRVLYWLDDAGRLHARIEGSIKGKLEFEEWTWTRGFQPPLPPPDRR
jgi:hypothetical protein